MGILNEVKESLKTDMQNIFNTELVVMHSPVSFYNGVIYCVLNSVKYIKHKSSYKFKLQGTVKAIKNTDGVDLGVLTELILFNNNAVALSSGKITFLSEVVVSNVCCIDFVFISKSYSVNANNLLSCKYKIKSRGC